MDLLLISLLLFSALSRVYPSTTNESKQWQHNTSNINDALDRCVCWPGDPPKTIQQQLDPQNNGHERLVIYLYKNDVTNEIKMYTPNANKQMLMPEIPYETGDGLVTVTTENVYSLLYNNPNKIKVYNDHIEKIVPTVIESLAIGLNTGSIEHFYTNGENYLNPNNNYKGNEYTLAKPKIIIANGPSGDVVTEPENENIPINIFLEPYNPNTNILTPEQNWMGNNYLHINPDEPQVIPLNPQTTADNAQSIPEDTLAISINPQSPPYKVQVIPINSQLTGGGNLPNAQVTIDEMLLYNSQDHSINSQAIPGNLQSVPVSYVGALDQNIVYTFLSDQGLNKLQPGSQDNNDLLSAQYTTFNIWFSLQMKRFQNVHLPSDIKTIDSNTLKILVQETLYENSIYISADGVITDANGKVIDSSNLELRPLLLGEIINNQHLQSGKIIQLPKHLPYLEGILVTLVSPPRILGIIPLGKTYLPEAPYQTLSLNGLTYTNGSNIYINGIDNSNVASYSTAGQGTYTSAHKDIYAGPTYYAYSGATGVPVAGNLNLETYSKALPVAYSIDNNKPQQSELNYWSSGPYQTGSNLPYPSSYSNPSELNGLLGQRRNNPEAVIQHYEQALPSRKKATSRKKHVDLKENATTVEPFLTINATESGRRFPGNSISSVMQTLLYLLDGLPSRRGLNSTGVNIVDESESSNDGEAPDFRIIGGNAATGSGTPLSNKGRSGMEYAV